jgi:enterochelin esterase-like enzyme
MRQYGGRTVSIHLPPGYDETRAQPYPVFVLHDGQNLFASRPEAIGGSWHADAAFDLVVAEGAIPPMVLVGIDHAGAGRLDEFAPPALGRRSGARAYADLVIDAVLPGLASDLNVRLDREGLGIGGASMGGLVSLWIASTRPDRFSRVMAMSPSVWWNRRSILRVLKRQPIDPSTRVWVDAGAKEGARVMRDAEAVVDLLHAQGARRATYVEDAEGDHSESSWARRLPEALRFLWEEGGAG